METKKLIRKNILALRDGMDKEERNEKSKKIANRLMQLETYKKAQILVIYVNYKSEVSTQSLIKTALLEGKKVYCPKVCEGEMEFYRIDSLEELSEGYMGIREPKGETSKKLTVEDMKEEVCLMIMPGSVFDRERNRIGYGKGYYDKYIGKYPYFDTAALCFVCQLIDEVPAKEYDIRPDMVITECEIL